MLVHAIWQMDRFQSHLCLAAISKRIFRCIRHIQFQLCHSLTSGVTGGTTPRLSPNGSLDGAPPNASGRLGKLFPKESSNPDRALNPLSKPLDPNGSDEKPFDLKFSPKPVPELGSLNGSAFGSWNEENVLLVWLNLFWPFDVFPNLFDIENASCLSKIWLQFQGIVRYIWHITGFDGRFTHGQCIFHLPLAFL